MKTLSITETTELITKLDLVPVLKDKVRQVRWLYNNSNKCTMVYDEKLVRVIIYHLQKRIKELELKASQSQPTDEIEPCVIMHGNKVFRGLYFTSVKSARNYIKMQYPKRHFKEISENKFTDNQYGATFEIFVLQKI